MNKTYSFYIDESGLFQQLDTHVICPLVIEDDSLRMDEIIALWSRSIRRDGQVSMLPG